jgi:transcriptional regulator with XRE-family HTH domain
MVRRQLGRRLRRLREEAGKSHADVATARIASATKMWRIESGKIAVKPGDVWALARLYDLSTELTDALVALAVGTHDVGWWAEYAAVVPHRVGLYVGLEAASSAVSIYHPELVPGLLQTEDYARAVIRADDRLGEEEVEQRVAFRLGRQRAVLERADPARLTAVLGAGAGALALQVGSDTVMEAQTRHLHALGDSGRVDIRVLPWEAGAHPSMRGAFTLLDFADPDDPSMVHVELLTATHYLERPEDVAEYRRIFGILYDKAVPIEEHRLRIPYLSGRGARPA